MAHAQPQPVTSTPTGPTIAAATDNAAPSPSPAGHRRWYIADAYLPSSGQGQLWEGHESICVLNVCDICAHLRLTLFYEDRPPLEDIRLTIEGRRCRHIAMHKPEELGGLEVPRDVPYGIEVVTDMPVVVQYSRLDVTQPNFTLMTTIPFALD